MTAFKHRAPSLLLPVLAAMILGGCATKEFVQQEMSLVGTRIDTLENLLNAANQRIEKNSGRINDSEGRLTLAEQSAITLAKRSDETAAGLAGANQRMNSIADDLSSAQKQIETSNGEIVRAHQRLDQVDERVDQTSRRLQGTVANLVMTQSRVGTLEEGLKSVNQAVNQALSAASAVSAPAVLAEAAVTAEAASHANKPVNSSPASLDNFFLASLVGAEAKPAVAATSGLAEVSAARAESVESAATAGAESAQNDPQSRLERITALLAVAGQKIDANSEALAQTAARVGSLEKGLAATDQRAQENESGLKLTQQNLGVVEQQLSSAKSQIQGNSDALAKAEQRIDSLTSGLTQADDRLGKLETDLTQTSDRLATGEKEITASKARIVQAEETILQQSERITYLAAEDSKISALAQEGLERAQAANKLAEGKLIFETTLSEDVARFGFEKAQLTDVARAALMNIANQLKTENKNVYIEIQGHTDSSGAASVNLLLSQQRAERVRDFLHHEAGIPLHRLSVAAYGESSPVADNKTKKGRKMNRRVVLVVLK